MNPKTVNDLDPKLKETYERVMGTSLAPTPSTPVPTQSVPNKLTPTTVEQNPLDNTQIVTPITLQPLKPAPQMVASPQSTKPTNFPGVVIPSTGNLMKATTTTPKKKSLKPILFLAGGVIFFIAYAVTWLKIFGLF